MHEKLDIAHRDLKPENILVNDDLHVKLIDFDSCIEIKNNDHYPIFGTKSYRCPSSSLHYDVIKGDIYSLGIKFFVGQMAALIMFNSQNFILSQVVNPAEVTVFNIAKKLFGLPLMCFMIVLTPYWSAITAAYTKDELYLNLE